MIFFKNNASANYEKIFYDFSINDISGKELNFVNFKNKVILLVNTASYCGFTKQYDDLQFIWDKYKNKILLYLAVPSNSFNQEKNSNDEVKKFCEFNFNITFPITEITDVKGKMPIHYINGLMKIMDHLQLLKWNFHKILINKDGKIEDTYTSLTNPKSKKLLIKLKN